MSSAAFQHRLLHLLLGAVGAAIATPGCGAKVVIDRNGSGGGGGEGGGTSSSSSTSSSSTGSPIDCKPHLVSSSQVGPMGTCVTDPNAFSVNVNCFSMPPAPATCADAFTDACILSTYECGFIQGGDSIACGPTINSEGQCCYTITGGCAVGRPFTIDGHARLGALIPGDGWGTPLAPDLATIDAATRIALEDAWGREALFEHASVASFARFALQLLALGAPADLVAGAQRALADEIEHARTCVGLASAYAGVALAPGPLAIDGALADCADAVAIATSLAREGCVAETVAALLVQRAHEEASDPVVKAALGRIAGEEAEHAALAWRALAWIIETGSPAVRDAVAAVFSEAEVHTSLGAVTDRPGDAAALRAHGYLPVEERRAVAREALGRVVGPAATALLGAAYASDRTARSAASTSSGPLSSPGASRA